MTSGYIVCVFGCEVNEDKCKKVKRRPELIQNFTGCLQVEPKSQLSRRNKGANISSPSNLSILSIPKSVQENLSNEKLLLPVKKVRKKSSTNSAECNSKPSRSTSLQSLQSSSCKEKQLINPVKKNSTKNPGGFSFLKSPFFWPLEKQEGPRRRCNSDSTFDFLSITKKKKKRIPVKKSVSFSLETTCTEQQKHKRINLHETKIYQKGVLAQASTTTGEKKASITSGTSSGCRNKNNISKKEKKEISDAGTTLGGLDYSLALLTASREGDDETLKNILNRLHNSDEAARRLVDFDLADNSGRTSISYLSELGKFSALEKILTIFTEIDPNFPDNEGNTPLHFSSQAGQVECLNILLQKCPHEINIDARNCLGFTPLMKAAIQGRTKCAKILLFAGANPTLRDHGRGLRAEQWARFCGRHVCAEVIERFARHRLLEKTTSTCRWGSEPELALQVLQGKLVPIPQVPATSSSPSTGLKSKIRRVFRSSSNNNNSNNNSVSSRDRYNSKNFSLVSQLTSAALCASSPALPKPGQVPPLVKSLLRPLNVPQLRITLVEQQIMDKSEKSATTRTDEKSNGTTDSTENSTTKISKSSRKKSNAK